MSVAMHDGWCGYGISRINPTEGSLTLTRPKPSDPTRDGVLGYVEEGGAVASMFEHFCTRNLCAENWEFVVAACTYEVPGRVKPPSLEGWARHGGILQSRHVRRVLR